MARVPLIDDFDNPPLRALAEKVRGRRHGNATVIAMGLGRGRSHLNPPQRRPSADLL